MPDPGISQSYNSPASRSANSRNQENSSSSSDSIGQSTGAKTETSPTQSSSSTTEERLLSTPTALENAVSMPTTTFQPASGTSAAELTINSSLPSEIQIDAADWKFYSGQSTLQAANYSYVENTSPDETAKDIVEANTTTRSSRGRTSTTTVNVQGVAADIVHLGRTDGLAFSGSVYSAAQNQGEVNSTQLEEAVDLEIAREHIADARLLGDAEPVEIIPEAAGASAEVLLDAHTKTTTVGRGRSTRTHIDVNSLAYDIEKLAKQRPSLAVASRLEIASQLSPDQASDLNRIISGNASIGENVEIAVENPKDGGIGILKGIANGFSAIGELFVKGSTMQAAAQQQQAAGYSALLGNDEMAEQQSRLGDELYETAMTEDFVPEFSIDNRAQQGGETIGFAIDVAMAGKGIITGGAKVLAKNADELAELAVKQTDELAGVSGRSTDNLIRLGDDLPTRIEVRDAPPRADLDQHDIDRFSFNHETNRNNIAEGVGTARADAVLDGNIRMPETNDLGVDFYVDDVAVSLKGPLLNGTSGAELQINSSMVEGLSKSVLKDVRLNSATDTIVVDTLNMSPIQRQQLQSSIETGLKSIDNSKTIIYLE